MIFSSLKNKIKKVSPSIIAIGFKAGTNQLTISGSGFSISDDGKILSAAHIYNQLPKGKENDLMGMVMVEQNKIGLNAYSWLPLKLIKKDDANDVALFQLEGHKKTLLSKLELGDSEKIDTGDDTYFIGFPYAADLINDGFGITLVVNKGIVSNIKRDGKTYHRNFIIIDAISNPGNSGCPLIDLKSNKVVGVMSISFRKQSKNQPTLDIREPMHICAARPVNLAKSLLEE